MDEGGFIVPTEYRKELMDIVKGKHLSLDEQIVLRLLSFMRSVAIFFDKAWANLMGDMEGFGPKCPKRLLEEVNTMSMEEIEKFAKILKQQQRPLKHNELRCAKCGLLMNIPGVPDDACFEIPCPRCKTLCVKKNPKHSPNSK